MFGASWVSFWNLERKHRTAIHRPIRPIAQAISQSYEYIRQTAYM
eukprot:COSAG01_NODE_6878_length_3457_cov_1.360631_1_plen_45_part_00